MELFSKLCRKFRRFKKLLYVVAGGAGGGRNGTGGGGAGGFRESGTASGFTQQVQVQFVVCCYQFRCNLSSCSGGGGAE